MLTLAGAKPEDAAKEAKDIMAFETILAKASMPVTERRDPANVYHLQTIAQVESLAPGLNFEDFEDAIHSPHVPELNDVNPAFLPPMLHAVRDTDMATLKAYMRYHLLTTAAGRLPKRFDDENFDFYSRTLNGTEEQAARWKRCSNAVNSGLGEALGAGLRPAVLRRRQQSQDPRNGP